MTLHCEIPVTGWRNTLPGDFFFFFTPTEHQQRDLLSNHSLLSSDTFFTSVIGLYSSSKQNWTDHTCSIRTTYAQRISEMRWKLAQAECVTEDSCVRHTNGRKRAIVQQQKPKSNMGFSVLWSAPRRVGGEKHRNPELTQHQIILERVDNMQIPHTESI